MNKTLNKSWLAILGLSIGILEILLLIATLVIALITLGLGWAVMIPLMLLLPVGLVGLIISLIARDRIKKHSMDGQKQARLGIVLNLIGAILGFLLLILLLLAMSSVFGQWI